MEKRAQFTLRGGVVVTILIAVLVAVFVPSFMRAMRRNQGSMSCRSNLRSLFQSQFNYAAQYGRPDGRMPEATGSDFFLALQRGPRPIIDRYEPFFCPWTDDEVGPGRTSYRGPALPISALSDQDPVAADKEGNHGPGEGGTILTKTGDAREVAASDALWIRTRTTTKE